MYGATFNNFSFPDMQEILGLCHQFPPGAKIYLSTDLTEDEGTIKGNYGNPGFLKWIICALLHCKPEELKPFDPIAEGISSDDFSETEDRVVLSRLPEGGKGVWVAIPHDDFINWWGPVRKIPESLFEQLLKAAGYRSHLSSYCNYGHHNTYKILPSPSSEFGKLKIVLGELTNG
jgi:hypothetical protein